MSFNFSSSLSRVIVQKFDIEIKRIRTELIIEMYHIGFCYKFWFWFRIILGKLKASMISLY
jgi:hypothetical protein